VQLKKSYNHILMHHAFELLDIELRLIEMPVTSLPVGRDGKSGKDSVRLKYVILPVVFPSFPTSRPVYDFK
jgi:hypothetical protein